MYWLTLLAGLGLFLSPFVLGIASHMADVRLGILFGLVIVSASLWEFGEPGRTRWPAVIICLGGLAVVVASFILGALGHTHMLGAGMALGTTAAVLGMRGFVRHRASG